MECKSACIVLLLAAVLALANGECAPPDALYPCTCKEKYLKCGNVSVEQLRAVFAAQKSHRGNNSLEEVLLTDYSQSYIPGGLLSGLDFYGFRINTSALRSFHDPHTNQSAFAGVEDKITGLDFSYTGRPIGDFDWSSLAPLKKLFNLALSGTFTAMATPLPHLPTVQIFSLTGTSIGHLHEYAFAGLTQIVDMRIVGNEIRSVDRSMFDESASKLKTFVIAENKVKVFPEDLYDDMPVLTRIQLSYYTHNIPSINVNLTTSLIAGPSLTCDCRLGWLLRMRDEGKVKIDLAYCARPQHLAGKEVNSLTQKDLL